MSDKQTRLQLLEALRSRQSFRGTSPLTTNERADGSMASIQQNISHGSGFDRRSGRRPMKEYPLTEGELHELAFNGMFVTIFLAMATFCFGLWIDFSKDLSMSLDLPESTRVFWETMRAVVFGGAVLSTLFAGLFAWRGKTRLAQIKRETSHEEASPRA